MVQRLCVRVAGAGVRVAGLPLGGVQVWLDDPGDRWRHYHRMARELRLAGWHTETGPDRLLLLGWSSVCLSHRARMLGAALTGRLADFDRTAFTAVMAATRLLHEGFPAQDLAAEVEARCRRLLRWPDRLDDLDGLQRTSSLEPMRLRLAQVAGLEAKVGRRCAAHLALAAKVARMVAGGAMPAPARRPEPRTAGRAGLTEPRTGGRPDLTEPRTGGRPGLTERMVCASVPNLALGSTTSRASATGAVTAR
ncbi:hypothetical protein MF672_028200 [Actinomadura sp. ATCC 31491]|uniref:Uncharacterized protein n=1 Tax=Actinomadura luzonensis TaxID=2805427 RepID=A0ABT0FZA4_9ACTN|nr:hypothetical protein [Actinomadura luzonensis]MCK2217645.1 hypothetical protein [Actinomadura luzonensis]